MLPVQDVIPSRQPPRVTLALIALGIAAAAYQLTLSQPARLGLLVSYGLVPASASTWRLITSQFLQPDLIAAVINLGALWIFGDNVEDRLGHARFLALFTVGGALASAVAVSLDPSARLILPASAGAVAAVIGTYVVLFPRSRVMVLVPLVRSVDIVDVPAALIAMGWLVLHALRYAGTWLSPEPLAGALVIPLAGFAIGTLAAPVLRQGSRMRVEWWSQDRAS